MLCYCGAGLYCFPVEAKPINIMESSLFSFLCLILFINLVNLGHVIAKEYSSGDKVVVYANKVGPYFNPHETYQYYELPICRPEKVIERRLSLGEVLDGDRLTNSLYKIKFKAEYRDVKVCKKIFTESDLSVLRKAVEDLYYFELVIDEIPVRAFIGYLKEKSYLPHSHEIYLWNHLHFNVEYNQGHIIYANVSTKDKAPISIDDVKAPFDVTFTYSVKWIPTFMKYSERTKRVRDNSFFPKTLEIHWLSIINSMVLVFLLIGFVIIILTRVLKRDFAQYNREDEDDEDIDDTDNGWKIIHTDVFRFPNHKNVFCAILGVGTQFLLIATGILLMAMLGMFNVHQHGQINAAGILLYALTSGVSGYIAASNYRKMGGENWVWNINLTSALFALPFFIVWSFVNSVSWAYGSTQALPWTTIILLGALWVFMGFPFTVIGGIFGKNWSSSFEAPCRTKNIAREIPSVPWYRSPVAHCLIGGFLPFSAISVELYYIFATLWGREHYTLYGILFIVYGILLSVTACISIALTYFQLSAEDYRWWWRSILSAGATGGFVFLYSLFYYFKRSNMFGILQSAQFFGYTILTCYVFFLMLGTVSFFASLKFIRYIYVNIKMD